MIHAAASARSALEVLRYLLDHGIDPNTRGSDHQTPLHDAAWTNNPAAIQLLLERSADIEAMDQDGYTPLDKTYRGSKAAFETLLHRGAKPGLFIAICHDRLNLAEQLIREQPFDALQARVPDTKLLFEWAEGCQDYTKAVELLRETGFEP